MLLNNKCQRVNLSNTANILTKLNHVVDPNNVGAEINKSDAENLFKIANSKKESIESQPMAERITEFYNSYIFSRNLLCSVFIFFITYMGLGIHYKFIRVDDIFIILIILSVFGFRWRQKAYYYTRLILNSSLLVI